MDDPMDQDPKQAEYMCILTKACSESGPRAEYLIEALHDVYLWDYSSLKKLAERSKTLDTFTELLRKTVNKKDLARPYNRLDNTGEMTLSEATELWGLVMTDPTPPIIQPPTSSAAAPPPPSAVPSSTQSRIRMLEMMSFVPE